MITLYRLNQLIALRNKLNKLGDYYYASGAGFDGSVYYVTREQFCNTWNERRIALRNKLNLRIHNATHADDAQCTQYDRDIKAQRFANDL